MLLKITFFKSGPSVTHAPHGVGDVGAQVVEPTLAALLADAAAAHEPRDVGPALCSFYMNQKREGGENVSTCFIMTRYEYFTGKPVKYLDELHTRMSARLFTMHADHVAQLVVLVRRPAALELGDLARPRAPTRAPALVAKGRGEGPAGRGLGVDRGVVDCGLVGRLGEPGQIVRKI